MSLSSVRIGYLLPVYGQLVNQYHTSLSKRCSGGSTRIDRHLETSVAQQLVQGTYKPEVGGASPPASTSQKKI